MNKKGFFISVEGGEGVGKSTAIEVITNYLDSIEVDFVLTREPGGTKIGEEIRHILLNQHKEIMHSDTELLLMFAARAQNIHQVILPALNEGKWVVSDRFTDASFAYQGGGRGIPFHRISELVAWVCGNLQPNLTLLLDAPVSVGYERIQNRGQKDRIESEGLEFLERIRKTYLQLADKYSERFRIIEADKDMENVHQQILSVIKPFVVEYSK